MTQDQEDAFNGLIQRYQRLELSSFEFHREWRALGPPPAETTPEGWNRTPSPDRPEDCDNLDALEGWWEVELQGHLVPDRNRKVLPTPKGKYAILAVYLIVSFGGLILAFQSGWLAILLVLGGMALFLKPIRREMREDSARSDRHVLARVAYQKRRNELIELNPEELRWEASSLEYLESLDNRDDVERWWRYAHKRLQFEYLAGQPFRPTRSHAVDNLIAGVLVGLMTLFPAFSIGRTNPTRGCLVLLACWVPILPILLSARKVYLAAREYDHAVEAYQRRLEELGEEPDW